MKCINPDADAVFNSENAYRVITVLRAFNEAGMYEVLISDIARGAKISSGTALYWVDIYEACGFIGTRRYDYRENALCRNARQITVHIGGKWTNGLVRLYAQMWIQKWEASLMRDLGVEKHLRLMQNAA